MAKVCWVIEPEPGGVARVYRVVTAEDGSFEVSEPAVWPTSELLFSELDPAVALPDIPQG
jgi:hypothetical protein